MTTKIQSITVTPETLLAALTKWQAEFLAGHCLTHEEADAVPFEQGNIERRDYLWSLLTDA
jgi:hypothetical protein